MTDTVMMLVCVCTQAAIKTADTLKKKVALFQKKYLLKEYTISDAVGNRLFAHDVIAVEIC